MFSSDMRASNMEAKFDLKAGLNPALRDEILTPAAMQFLVQLHEQFNGKRLDLLQARAERQARIDAGQPLGFLESTKQIRESAWVVAPAPQDLNDRRVEITGPVERK